MLASGSFSLFAQYFVHYFLRRCFYVLLSIILGASASSFLTLLTCLLQGFLVFLLNILSIVSTTIASMFYYPLFFSPLFKDFSRFFYWNGSPISMYNQTTVLANQHQQQDFQKICLHVEREEIMMASNLNSLTH
ncbi:uncharacterized protein LOC124885610 isoform X2 [Capsicum annuum]|uniref:uncharacterized protein LOC124885610 isoform X2 n=1 Tax=Capsicum annuum TaxID=4072 RepID=UPI001FB051DE|nr:uncharacterized protein LOC124885610 isoform X2 [Capsicum annuum]